MACKSAFPRFTGYAPYERSRKENHRDEKSSFLARNRVLRRLESLLIAADQECTLIIGGSGDVIEPTDHVAGIGSGGMYAAAAAKALLKHTNLSARDIVEQSLHISGEICVYSNQNVVVDTIG